MFRRYTGFLRGLKIVYVVNNLLHAKKLRRNEALYRRYGLKKSVFSPIGMHDFAQASPEVPWLDRPGAEEALRKHPRFNAFDAATQQELLRFEREGYMILKGFYTEEAAEAVNREVERLLGAGATGFNYTKRKIMDAHEESALISQGHFRNPRMLDLLSFVMGRSVVPFQTINFVEGSEQRAHSDFIHMTTEPLGYLIATWTALEDTHEGNGPLFYYPGSHRLPYVSCLDYAAGNTRWRLGENSYRKYEDYTEALIRERGLEKRYFHAKKGDVLIWHANLLHGGSPILEKGATRRSMVSHYFCEGVICYHEISQRPALVPF
jgi:ectoine hydroxylase